MRTVTRIGTFETNSSSTHALVIGTVEEIDSFVAGLLVHDGNKFISKEEIMKSVRYKDFEKDWINNYENDQKDISDCFDEYLNDEMWATESYKKLENEDTYQDMRRYDEEVDGKKVSVIFAWGFDG